MTRPLTCLTLLAAAGAGLYLYQEKHRAQLLDRAINRTVHATEQIRERSGMMRAEWALLSEPERLAGLAAQHLALQGVAPAQYVQWADLASRLPPVGVPASVLAAPAAAPPADMPVAVALPAKPVLPLAQAGPAPMLPPRPTGPVMTQLARPARPVRLAAKATEPEVPAERPYSPVMTAYAAPPPMRAPSVQQASSVQQAPVGVPAPYVGSALGMSRSLLAAPVPVTLAAPVPVTVAMGSAPGR